MYYQIYQGKPSYQTYQSVPITNYISPYQIPSYQENRINLNSYERKTNYITSQIQKSFQQIRKIRSQLPHFITQNPIQATNVQYQSDNYTPYNYPSKMYKNQLNQSIKKSKYQVPPHYKIHQIPQQQLSIQSSVDMIETSSGNRNSQKGYRNSNQNGYRNSDNIISKQIQSYQNYYENQGYRLENQQQDSNYHNSNHENLKKSDIRKQTGQNISINGPLSSQMDQSQYKMNNHSIKQQKQQIAQSIDIKMIDSAFHYQDKKNRFSPYVQADLQIQVELIFCIICNQTYAPDKQSEHLQRHKSKLSNQSIKFEDEVKKSNDLKNRIKNLSAFKQKPIFVPQLFNVQKQVVIKERYLKKEKQQKKIPQKNQMYTQYQNIDLRNQGSLKSAKRSKQKKLNQNKRPELSDSLNQNQKSEQQFFKNKKALNSNLNKIQNQIQEQRKLNQQKLNKQDKYQRENTIKQIFHLNQSNKKLQNLQEEFFKKQKKQQNMVLNSNQYEEVKQLKSDHIIQKSRPSKQSKVIIIQQSQYNYSNPTKVNNQRSYIFNIHKNNIKSPSKNIFLQKVPKPSAQNQSVFSISFTQTDKKSINQNNLQIHSNYESSKNNQIKNQSTFLKLERKQLQSFKSQKIKQFNKQSSVQQSQIVGKSYTVHPNQFTFKKTGSQYKNQNKKQINYPSSGTQSDAINQIQQNISNRATINNRSVINNQISNKNQIRSPIFKNRNTGNDKNQNTRMAETTKINNKTPNRQKQKYNSSIRQKSSTTKRQKTARNIFAQQQIGQFISQK